MENKTAIISGIYGQDGSFICEELVKKDYKVYGIVRTQLSEQSEKIKKELIGEGIDLEECHIDLYDYSQVERLIREIQPDELYHMAAYHVSSEGKGNGDYIREQELFNKNVLATANILEACKKSSPNTKIVTAGSSLMFDACECNFQSEETLFSSQSLYGLAKISESMLVKYYRKVGLFACTAILYNHESHRRGSGFVTKKIVENMVKIKYGLLDRFSLGNLNVEKDWGYAGDYAKAMILMATAEEPIDYIISTGEMHTIKDVVNYCAEKLDIRDWEKYVEIDENIISRKISGRLCGNSMKIVERLGWKREKNFSKLIDEMICYEEELYKLK